MALQVSEAIASSTAHMFIVNPLTAGGLANLFSTHPAMEERIARREAMAKDLSTCAADAGLARQDNRRQYFFLEPGLELRHFKARLVRDEPFKPLRVQKPLAVFSFLGQ